ncbi:MAG: CHASE2 domain-containing protein [Candidatus Adiutrix sp.]|jgi:putative nucleotidyltransferase with HDIG domain|nr:CHASE2 domain-containing protein [Candidatus Adiutrix sp.]
MAGFLRSRAGTAVLALIFALLGGWLAVAAPPFFNGPEMAVFDFYQSKVQIPPLPEKIVVVLAQERSLREVGAWPWPRRLHAQLLGRLNLARAVALDILFSETSNPEDDALLAAVARQSGKFVAATQLVVDAQTGQIMNILNPYPELAEAAADLALVNVDPEPDGIYRDYRLVWPVGDEVAPSLALSLFLASGRPMPEITAEGEGYRLDLASGPVRLDGSLTFKINHYPEPIFLTTPEWAAAGPPEAAGPAMTVYEYADVLAGRAPPESFRDALVLVGINVPGASDQFAIGRGRILPGTVYIANALRTLLGGWIPTPAPDWALALAGAALALFGGLLGLVNRTRAGLWLWPPLALWAGLTAWLFLEHRLWLPPLTPLAGSLAAFALATALKLRFLSADLRVQGLSIDTMLFHGRRDFDPAKTTFADYMRNNWAEVEHWSGVTLLAPFASAYDPEAADLLAARRAAPAETERDLAAAVVTDRSGLRRLLLALPEMGEDQGQRFTVLGWHGRLSVETIKSVAALVLSSAMHFKALEENLARHELFMGVLRLIMGAVDAKDPTTAGHSERVAELARELARKSGLEEEEVERIYLGGLLHDVGKIGIPDRILNKPGRLDDEEINIMRSHPALGARLMSQIKLPETVMRAIVEHHERLDGRGYPEGLTNQDLSHAGRILKIADVYDALISKRQYKTAMSLEQTYGILKEGIGTDFDPDLMNVLLADPFSQPTNQPEEANPHVADR